MTLAAEANRPHFVHPFAEVHNDCRVGRGTMIWQFASVIRGAWVGENCVVASAAVVDGCKIGNDCIIGHGSAVNPGIVINDRVFVGQNVSFCNDLWPAVSKEGFVLPEAVTVVNDGASVGSNCVILPGVVLGAGCVISAGTVVRNSVPEKTLLRPDGSTSFIFSSQRPRCPQAGSR